MPLRSPRYLNRSDFYDHAEYHDIEIPRRTEVIARTSTSRKAAGKVGLQGLGIPVGVEGHLGSNIEFQSAYTLETGEKAAFSKVLDAMERQDNAALATLPGAEPHGARWAVSKGQLVELSGTMALSPVSSIGKVMNVVLQLVGRDDVELGDLLERTPSHRRVDGDKNDDADSPGEEFAARGGVPAQAQDILRAVYLRNEIPQIPALFKLVPDADDAPWQVYVTCNPTHFVGTGAAETNSIEGEVTVVGVVHDLVDDDPHEGFLSTEPWTLHGWETTMRTALRPQMDEIVEKLLPTFEPQWSPGDDSYFIRGPAIIIDSVAIF